MRRQIALMMLAGVLTPALMGCGTGAPGSAASLRRIIGADLIGARGATPDDQRRIDRTVVGVCAGGVWTPGECARHGEAR